MILKQKLKPRMKKKKKKKRKKERKGGAISRPMELDWTEKCLALAT